MSLSKIVQESVEAELFKCSCSGDLLDYIICEQHGISGKKWKSHLISSQISLLEAELERKKGMINSILIGTEESSRAYKFKTDGYHKAIQEDITYLTEQIEEIKKTNL